MMRMVKSRTGRPMAVLFLLGAGLASANADKERKVIRFDHGGRGSVAYLGVQLTDLTPELRTHFGVPVEAGVMVSKVMQDSPAERSGLQPGDIITTVDGHPVTSGGDLAHEIHRLEAGQAVDLEVWRDERLETIGATLDERDWGHGHRFETVVVRCPDDDSDCEPEASHHPTFDCGGKQPCEVEVTCHDGDCECLVNGEPADCAEVSGFAHPHDPRHQN